MEQRINLIEKTVIKNNKYIASLMEIHISLEQQLQELIKHNNPPTITIKGAKQIDFIPLNEIIYCSADMAYTNVITKNHNTVIATKAIHEFETILENYSFYRISKSLLININQIHSYNRKNAQVQMKNKDILDVARRRKSDFLATILPNDK